MLVSASLPTWLGWTASGRTRLRRGSGRPGWRRSSPFSAHFLGLLQRVPHLPLDASGRTDIGRRGRRRRRRAPDQPPVDGCHSAPRRRSTNTMRKRSLISGRAVGGAGRGAQYGTYPTSATWTARRSRGTAAPTRLHVHCCRCSDHSRTPTRVQERSCAPGGGRPSKVDVPWSATRSPPTPAGPAHPRSARGRDRGEIHSGPAEPAPEQQRRSAAAEAVGPGSEAVEPRTSFARPAPRAAPDGHADPARRARFPQRRTWRAPRRTSSVRGRRAATTAPGRTRPASRRQD